jgi:hypothetical protein
MNNLTEQSFLKDVADHEMQILHEDGVYRHVRFKRPDSSCMHFDLITYPGFLVYSGDMGCFVFSRLRDMFEFFRTDRQYQKGDGLKINLGYWAEKLQAVDGNRSYVEGVKEFDEDKFTRNVMEYLVDWIRNHRDETTKEERRELWGEVVNDVVRVDGDSAGHRQQVAAHDFTHRVNKEVGEFYFQDFFERDCTCYTHRFLWCCYALAWGIKKYDDSKPAELAAA